MLESFFVKIFVIRLLFVINGGIERCNGNLSVSLKVLFVSVCFLSYCGVDNINGN